MRRPKSQSEPEIVELKRDDLLELDERAQADQFARGDGTTVHLLIGSHLELVDLLKDKEITLARLRKMLFGASTEKTKDIFPADLVTQPNQIKHTQ